jgi:hypothetical protein
MSDIPPPGPGIRSPDAADLGAHELAFTGYRSSLSSSTLAPSTRARYAARVRAYLAWLSESDLPGDTINDPIASDQAADRFLAHLRSAGKSPAVCAGYRAALNDFRARHPAGPPAGPAGPLASAEGTDTPAPAPSRASWLRRLTQPALKALHSFPGLLATTVITTVVAAAVSLGIRAVFSRPAPPVTVSVQDDPGQVPGLAADGQEGVIPAGTHITGSPGSPGCTGFAPWLKANGGISAETQVQLVVQSDTSAAVYISNMQVRVLRRSAPVAGPDVVCSSAGYGQVRTININLRTATPTVTYKAPSGNLPFSFTLENGETEVFDVIATGARSYYSYELVLDLTVSGKQVPFVVRDNGRPFRITPPRPGSATWDWDYGNAWDGPDGQSIRGGSQFPRELS